MGAGGVEAEAEEVMVDATGAFGDAGSLPNSVLTSCVLTRGRR